jgi:hypothetical protein
MCRTWSVRRFVPKPGGGPPLRSREGDQAWGISGLSENDSRKVFGDNQLLLRQMYLSCLSFKSSVRAPAFLIEHPSDPSCSSTIPGASSCGSIWALPAVISWMEELSLVQLHFDQCMLGQKVPKTTTLATNLPLHHWSGMFCDDSHPHYGVGSSSELGRYPANVMKGTQSSGR